MDDRLFDLLAITLTDRLARRDVISALLAVAGLGAGATAEARPHGQRQTLVGKPGARRHLPSRRRRRKRNGKGKGKGKDKGHERKGHGRGDDNAECTPDPVGTLCAGNCGTVTDTCGNQIECEPCRDCAEGAPDGTTCKMSGGETGACAGGMCEACGGKGQRCCTAGTPCADFGCCDPETGTCVTGGGVRDSEFAIETQCAAENMVCDCQPASVIGVEGWMEYCTAPGTCRLNHRPRVVPVSVRSTWKSPCVTITMTGLDADGDEMTYRITKPPKNGFVTEFVGRVVARNNAADAGSAVTREPTLEVSENAVLLWEGLPAPPLPDVEADCWPRAYVYDVGPIPDGRFCPECGGGPNGARLYCPEGFYWQWAVCYIPFSSTFTGFDDFAYVAVDIHGAVSEPASVQIEIFEG